MRITWKGISKALRRLRKKPSRPLVMGALEGQVKARKLDAVRWAGGPEEQLLRDTDRWFHDHYLVAPRIIRSALAPHLDLADSRVLDLGCGDGIMALGMRQQGTARVVATDLTRAFDMLLPKARDVLGMQALPDGLEFRQGQAGQPLPFVDGEFDAVYSWSVFEHVQDVEDLLGQVVRVLKPGGFFYLQIEPLYHSPFGSHLLRLIDEPWAHLLQDEGEYLARARAAQDHTTVDEMDLLYRNNDFDRVRQYLIGEYLSLNRIRTIDLVKAVRWAGLEILSCELGQVRQSTVPAILARHHELHDLITNEIRLVMRRP